MATLIQGLRGIPQSHESQTTTLVPCQEGPPLFAFHSAHSTRPPYDRASATPTDWIGIYTYTQAQYTQ